MPNTLFLLGYLLSMLYVLLHLVSALPTIIKLWGG